MFRIRRFGVIRTANIVAFLYVIIIAVIFVPVGLIVAVAGVGGSGAGFAGNVGGVAIVFFGLLLAIFYGIVGWIFTALSCLLYNFAAGMVGGIEIQLEAVQPPPPATVWGSTPTAPPPAPPPGTS